MNTNNDESMTPDQVLAEWVPPAALARELYQGVFGVQAEQERFLAMEIWRELAPYDRSYISAHLAYLELQAMERLERLLQNVQACSEGVEGATCALADELTRRKGSPRLPPEAQAGLRLPSKLSPVDVLVREEKPDLIGQGAGSELRLPGMEPGPRARVEEHAQESTQERQQDTPQDTPQVSFLPTSEPLHVEYAEELEGGRP